MSVTAARELRARLVRFDWRWAAENRAQVTEHWRQRQARTPAIFNGRVLMVCGLRFDDERCEADLFETDYAALIAWIDGGCPGDGSVANGFAMGALEASDGAFLLGRMGEHTANAGRLYFPCGTPDRTDVGVDGTVDLAGSLLREIEEETGFSERELTVEDGWIVVRDGGLLAFMRRVRLHLGAEPARARILAHLARDARAELADIVVVRRPHDLAGETRMPGVVPIFLRHAFAAGEA